MLRTINQPEYEWVCDVCGKRCDPHYPEFSVTRRADYGAPVTRNERRWDVCGEECLATLAAPGLADRVAELESTLARIPRRCATCQYGQNGYEGDCPDGCGRPGPTGVALPHWRLAQTPEAAP